MNNSQKCSIVLVVGGLLAGCVTVSDSTSTSEGSKSTGVHASALQTDGLARKEFRILAPDGLEVGKVQGFRHTADRSRFSRGSGMHRQDESDGSVRREVTSIGMFIELSNGFSSGIPNGDAPSLTRGPLSKDSTVHSQHVVNYFLSAGLPKDQVAGTEIQTWMREGGPTTLVGVDGSVPHSVVTSRELIGFVTRINRVVAGVHVPDSYAWAMFNSDGEAAYEQVWWPDLPASLGDEVKAFRDRLEDDEFRDRLDQGGAGELAIHHATPTGHGWFARVTYDVQPANGGSGPRHYSLDGFETSVVAW